MPGFECVHARLSNVFYTLFSGSTGYIEFKRSADKGSRRKIFNRGMWAYTEGRRIGREMTKPKVTVLIDTHNHERFIEEAIASVLEQDFSAAEMEILVKRGSEPSAFPNRRSSRGTTTP